jgi:hypothetical protein
MNQTKSKRLDKQCRFVIPSLIQNLRRIFGTATFRKDGRGTINWCVSNIFSSERTNLKKK